jgi:Fe-S cluster assembly ATP-binding protein
MDQGLIIDNLAVRRGDKEIFSALQLQVVSGELVILEGENGSGKSTLALTLLGHPDCLVTCGKITLEGADLLSLPVYERARHGLFLAHQEPAKIPGVTIVETLRASCEALQGEAFTVPRFYQDLRGALERLGLGEDFAQRSLNDQLSGGEKKRGELLALLLARPKIAVLDELDSGMDAVARALTRDIVAELRSAGTGFLLISHNSAWAQELEPTRRYSLT